MTDMGEAVLSFGMKVYRLAARLEGTQNVLVSIAELHADDGYGECTECERASWPCRTRRIVGFDGEGEE